MQRLHTAVVVVPIAFAVVPLCKVSIQIYIFLIEVPLTRAKLLYPFKKEFRGLACFQQKGHVNNKYISWAQCKNVGRSFTSAQNHILVVYICVWFQRKRLSLALWFTTWFPVANINLPSWKPFMFMYSLWTPEKSQSGESGSLPQTTTM